MPDVALPYPIAPGTPPEAAPMVTQVCYMRVAVCCSAHGYTGLLHACCSVLQCVAAPMVTQVCYMCLYIYIVRVYVCADVRALVKTHTYFTQARFTTTKQVNGRRDLDDSFICDCDDSLYACVNIEMTRPYACVNIYMTLYLAIYCFSIYIFTQAHIYTYSLPRSEWQARYR